MIGFLRNYSFNKKKKRTSCCTPSQPCHKSPNSTVEQDAPHTKDPPVLTHTFSRSHVDSSFSSSSSSSSCARQRLQLLQSFSHAYSCLEDDEDDASLDRDSLMDACVQQIFTGQRPQDELVASLHQHFPLLERDLLQALLLPPQQQERANDVTAWTQAAAFLEAIRELGLESFFTLATEPQQRPKDEICALPVQAPLEERSWEHVMQAVSRAQKLPGPLVAKQLFQESGEQVDLNILSLIHESALETYNETEEQAAHMATTLVEMGLGKFFGKDSLDSDSDDKKPAASPTTSDCFFDCEQVVQTGVTFTCPVCFDEKDLAEQFEFQCGLDPNNNIHKSDSKVPAHVLCFSCAQRHLTSHLDSNNPNPKCFAQNCEHVLTDVEVAGILGRGNVHAGFHDRRFTVLDNLKRDHAIGKDPSEFASCPGPHCSWTVARSSKGATEKATCGQCQFSFCTNCLSSYHYRTTCAERRQIQDSWRQWVLVGRSKYWKEDTKRSIKAEKASKLEKKRIERVIKTEAQDEDWKAKNCRHCPHCDRLVNRLEGCSIMRCGYDTDTKANVQNGCQNRFDWNQAKPYEPVKVGTHVKTQRLPGKSQKEQHLNWNCDACQKSIVGLRFECINCPAFSLCEDCEQSNTSSHSGGSHTFRIVDKAG